MVAEARGLLRYAEPLKVLGVSPFWLLCNAYGAEVRVAEWLAAHGLRKHQLVYHVHELLRDEGMSTLRAASVQEALIERAVIAPDSLDEVARVLSPPPRVGRPRVPLSERQRDADELEALGFAKKLLRAKTPPPAGPLREAVARHGVEMRRRGRRPEQQALLLWAEWTDRREREPLRLEDEAKAIRGRVKTAERTAKMALARQRKQDADERAAALPV